MDRARSSGDPLPVDDALPSRPDSSDDGDSNHDGDLWEHFGQDVLAAEFAEEQNRDGQGGEGGLLFHRTPKFQWGSFKVRVKPPGPTRPHGVWQVQCPFHTLRDSSYCRRTCPLRESTAADEHAVIRALKAWALEAEKHDRQWKHIAEPVLPDFAPDDATLDAMLTLGNLQLGPPVRYQTDEFLDVLVHARGRGRGCAACARGRAGRGRRGRGARALGSDSD